MNILNEVLESLFEGRDGTALTLRTARVVIHVTRFDDVEGLPAYYALSGAPLGAVDREYTCADDAVAAALRILAEYAL